jgi:hypothetical protein
VARLPRVALLTAGATTLALAACNNDDSLAVPFYGGICPPDACILDADAATDAAFAVDADARDADDLDARSDGEGGPPLDSGSDADGVD